MKQLHSAVALESRSVSLKPKKVILRLLLAIISVLNFQTVWVFCEEKIIENVD